MTALVLHMFKECHPDWTFQTGYDANHHLLVSKMHHVTQVCPCQSRTRCAAGKGGGSGRSDDPLIDVVKDVLSYGSFLAGAKCLDELVAVWPGSGSGPRDLVPF